ncbi:hypothetical protein Tco_0785025 [Tanacetum coccineum]
MDIALTRLSFILLLLNASTTTFDLSKRHINHSSKSGKPLLVLRPTHTSDSLIEEVMVLTILEKTILAFLRVLDDMETSRLASLQELISVMRNSDSVVAVVNSDSLFGQINKKAYDEVSLAFVHHLRTIRFLLLLEYDHLDHIGLSDIGSPRANDHEYLELPWMPEDPYVEAVLQAPPSPDYVPGPEEPEQAPPSPDYVPGPEHADDKIVDEDQPYAEDASPTA